MEGLKGKRVSRLDSISLDETYFTQEGYLIDKPILTSCGIFEYRNRDGSVRRELRLPEYVFEEESLKSYSGKPVIITHGAGRVTKHNVRSTIVGTIISEGQRDGQDVKANIVIHDVDAVKNSGMRELSLGYDVDVVDKSGVWNGQHYDAIQTNIRINHLAIVKKGRAGEQAHLNMDHKESISDDNENILEGGKKKMSMSEEARKKTRNDAMLTPAEFAASIEAYKAEKERLAGGQVEGAAATEIPDKQDAEKKPAPEQPAVVPEAPVLPTGDKAPVEAESEKGSPASLEEALQIIASMSDDIQKLHATIDKMQAEKDLNASVAEPKADSEEKPVVASQAEPVTLPITKKEEEKPMNMDSIDAIVSQKLELGKVGQKLHLDGLETMDIRAAKEQVIMAVKPGMRLDGKSDAYIDAAYDMARNIANELRTTDDQRNQMAKGQRLDSMEDEVKGPSCNAYESRQQLINRRENRG